MVTPAPSGTLGTSVPLEAECSPGCGRYVFETDPNTASCVDLQTPPTVCPRTLAINQAGKPCIKFRPRPKNCGVDQPCQQDEKDEAGTLTCGECKDEDNDGYSTCDGDCDDSNTPEGFNTNPGAQEICGNNRNDNCDTERKVDETPCCDASDRDDDGVSECDGDCNDNDPTDTTGACATPTPAPTPTPPQGGCSTSPNFFGNCPAGYTNNGCNGCCSDAERDGCTSSGGYFYARAGTCQGGVCFDQQYECMAWGEYWNMYLCQCTGPCPGTPVLVDVLGDGFKLTGGPGGVNFDLNGDGSPERLSWTAAGTDDAWLVFDRDGDGVIGKGAEMFGNFTYQPNAPAGGERHGFLALAEFDRPAGGGNGNLGGNGDGVLDARDAVFSFLRLWRDVNHNGVSEAGELRPLPRSGLASIDLGYKESKRADAHGNRLRYRAKVKDARGAHLGRWAYDVFLVSGP